MLLLTFETVFCVYIYIEKIYEIADFENHNQNVAPFVCGPLFMLFMVLIKNDSKSHKLFQYTAHKNEIYSFN